MNTKETSSGRCLRSKSSRGQVEFTFGNRFEKIYAKTKTFSNQNPNFEKHFKISISLKTILWSGGIPFSYNSAKITLRGLTKNAKTIEGMTRKKNRKTDEKDPPDTENTYNQTYKALSGSCND